MISFDEYIGIPYLKDGNDRNGIDCWRLYVMVCREIMGIELPELRGIFFGRISTGSQTSYQGGTGVQENVYKGRKTEAI